MQEIKIILESESRNQLQIQDLEQYFYSHFEYIRNLKSKLDAQLYMMLFESIKYEKFPPLTPIFEAGDIGRKMYFIIEGSVGIFKPRNIDSKPYPGKYHTFQEITERRYYGYQLVNILKSGTYFGEVALHQKGPRNASVCSICKVEVAIITYDTYQKILALAGQQQNDYKFNFLKSISLFEGWRDSALLAMLMNCEEQYYSPFAKIFKLNQPVDYVYFIVSGEVLLKNYCQVQESEESPRKIKKIDGLTNLTTGQYFGDQELYNDQCSFDQLVRTSQAETKSSCKLLKICALQFIENYRLFSTISKPRAISQRQLRHRSSMQEIRDKVVSQQAQVTKQKIVPKIKDFSNSQDEIPVQPTMPQIPVRFLVKFGQIQSQDYLTYRSTASNDFFKFDKLKAALKYMSMKETDQTFINCVSKKKISQKSPLRRRTYSIK